MTSHNDKAHQRSHRWLPFFFPGGRCLDKRHIRNPDSQSGTAE